MKKIFIILAAALIVGCNQNDAKPVTTNTSTADSTNANVTSIEWLDPIDQKLSPITEGQEADLTWRFKNTGNNPLVISDVTASCGCTVAEKPEKPVMPGEESAIKAKFNSSGKVGENNKQVTVVANTNDTKRHLLSFSVTVNSKQQ